MICRPSFQTVAGEKSICTVAFGDPGTTRRKVIQLPPITRPVGGGQGAIVNLPRVGLLSAIYLNITGAVSGTLSAPNAFGFASVIQNVNVAINSGISLFSMSGQGYNYLLRPYQDLGDDPVPQSTARSAVTATTFNLDMIIPIAMNPRDALGLIMLQSEQTLLTLQVTFLPDASVATGATVTATVTPYAIWFTVPANEKDWPNLGIAHQILEEQTTVPATGQFTYNWQRGNIYLQTVHGLGFGASGADSFSHAQLRVNQSDYIYDDDTAFFGLESNYFTIGQTRLPGVLPFNLIGTAGFGAFDATRDTIDSSQLTDLATVLTATSTGTLYTMRRQLVPIGG